VAEKLPTYQYTITYADSPSSTVATVDAAYMQEEGRFVAFKDAQHGVVFAVNVDAVIAVQRQEPRVADHVEYIPGVGASVPAGQRDWRGSR
jgi:hypothetical protein